MKILNFFFIKNNLNNYLINGFEFFNFIIIFFLGFGVFFNIFNFNLFSIMGYNIMYLDSFTFQCDGIIHLHNLLFCLIFSIVVFVFGALLATYKEYLLIYKAKYLINHFIFDNIFSNKTSNVNSKNISLIKITKNKSTAVLFVNLIIQRKHKILKNLRFSSRFSQLTRSMEFLYNYTNKVAKVCHGTVVETIWTTIPSLILLSIAIPSFGLLYSLDESYDCCANLKILGNQWYWSYDAPFFTSSFDSYLISEQLLSIGKFRLLEVDYELILPSNVIYRFAISASDVLHCWTLPSIGVKVDACPGRLNLGFVIFKQSGILHGQCSEICGVGHGFMPISIAVVDEFLTLFLLFEQESFAKLSN